MDADNGNVYFYKNGVIENGGNAYTIGTAPHTGEWFITCGDYDSSHSFTMECNYGNPPYAISSGNADANGYGNFEYAVPSGFYALCTKNLNEYG